MIIRDMCAADIEQILEIERQSFQSPWSRAAFESELKNLLAHYLLLVEDDKVIGYAGFWQILDEGHITNVALLPTYRGRGLAKRLIGQLIDRARQLNIVQMTLEVRPSNAVARQLYTSFGFSVEGRRPRYYSDSGEDALIMWLDIAKMAEKVKN